MTSSLPVAAALVASLALQDGKPGGVDTEKLGKDLANKVQAKLLVANPISEILKGWIVGNDPGPNAIECWDLEAGRLRITLVAGSEEEPSKSVNAEVDADVSAYGLTRVGEPIRAAAPRVADVIHVYQRKQPNSLVGFWVRAVTTKPGFPANLLMATFHALPKATPDEFLKDLNLRKEGVKAAFDAYLAIGLRELQTWTGDKQWRLSLDGVVVSMSAPLGWKRVQSPDLVAGWESSGGTLRVTADVLRFPSIADAGDEHLRWIEKKGGEIVGTPKVDKSSFEVVYAAPEHAQSYWHLLRLVQAGGLVFELHASGVRKDRGKKLERIPDPIRGPIEASLKSFKAAAVK